MVVINSNVNSWQVAARIKPAPVDTFTIRIHRIEANQLRSPSSSAKRPASRVPLSG